MLKIFWDKDNIAFMGDRINTETHSHCALQIFLSLGDMLQVIVENEQVNGKCVITNKNVRHKFSCGNAVRLSVIVKPDSRFARELVKTIDGNYLVCNDGIGDIQRQASALVDGGGKQEYQTFIGNFAEYLGVQRGANVLDGRISVILDEMQSCDCYDHTMESLAKKACLSPSRLSHLFREQIGVPLKSYIIFHQLEKAFTAILNGSNITEAAMLSGFDSPSHFAATVKKQMGMPVSVSLKHSEFLKVFS